jgi:hypothetical protein
MSTGAIYLARLIEEGGVAVIGFCAVGSPRERVAQRQKQMGPGAPRLKLVGYFAGTIKEHAALLRKLRKWQDYNTHLAPGARGWKEWLVYCPEVVRTFAAFAATSDGGLVTSSDSGLVT